MRVLLIAYDFPPIPSPQSLRWAYLVRELSRLGHEVRVLSADLPGYGPGGLPEVPESVAVHRVHPGLLSAGRRLRLCRVCKGVPSERAGVSARPSVATPFERLNWKGRLVNRVKSSPFGDPVGGILRAIRKMASTGLFPDYRAEWAFWAKGEFHRILRDFVPDVVITSHEPAFTLPLGAAAKRRGFRWVADLGDPVAAAYTPTRWRNRAMQLEREVCRHADLITVTTCKTIDQLASRHGVEEGRFLLLTQGFDSGFARQDSAESALFEPDRLELLYAGSFYAFRRIDALLQAVLSTPRARITIATISAPPEVLKAAAERPESVRLLGFVRHDQVLALQRECDVLVNIANDDPVQVPGKVYEYLGARTRILQVGEGLDAASELLERSGIGVSEKNDVRALSSRLTAWRDEKLATRRRLTCVIEPSFGADAYSWQALAKKLAKSIENTEVDRLMETFPEGNLR